MPRGGCWERPCCTDHRGCGGGWATPPGPGAEVLAFHHGEQVTERHVPIRVGTYLYAASRSRLLSRSRPLPALTVPNRDTMYTAQPIHPFCN